METMFDWDFLIDEDMLASVLPDEYARFARPVKDALTVFLNGLSNEHQSAIVAEQAKLSSDATVSERLALLARSCPVLHKLGQILARDPRLALELRQQLQELESLSPSVPIEAIRETLTQELGSLDQLGIKLITPAIAEASVAVVIAFETTGDKKGQQGVFKLLKPGIEQRLEEELKLTEQVGAHLDQRCEELEIPHLDYRDAFEQVREKLQWEIRLDQEQRHMEQAQAFYANEPRVQIPALFEYCTQRVTAMQRVTGKKITEHGLTSPKEKRELAELVVESLVARPIFSKDSRVLFHCDPHAGNLFFTDDQRLAILDWSLAGTLGETERIAIVQIMLAAVSLDAVQIVRVLSELAERPPDGVALKSTVDAWLRRLRRGQFPGLDWLVGMLDDAVQTARLRVAADLMLFRKTLHTLDGLLLDLHANGNRMDGVILSGFLKQFAAEWPKRWVSTPTSREFATRLSNVDLTRCILGMPATAGRFWAGQIRDILSATKATNGKSN
jgi:ubiquinone biosynthesis protein